MTTQSTTREEPAVPRDTFFNLPEAKRQRIAEVAIEAFSRHPYEKVSISQLVAAAGIAKGSFYQYFEDKLDLFRWLLFTEIARRKMAYLKEIPPLTSGDFWAHFELMLLAGIRFALQHPRLSRVGAAAWRSSGDAELNALHDEFLDLAVRNWHAILSKAQQEGHLRADVDLDVATEFTLAVMVQGLDLAMRRKLGVDLLEFCSRPELAERFPEREQRALIRQNMDVLRRGLGVAKPPIATSQRRVFDLDALPEPPWAHGREE